MGSSLSSIWPGSARKKEARVIMWGPWYSGKTTFLYNRLLVDRASATVYTHADRIQGWDHINPVSTIGFNVESVTYRNQGLTIWDLGGRDKFRPAWRQYFSNIDAVIYIVDATETDRLDDAASTLEFLLSLDGPRDELSSAPVLVFANKQDLDGALSAEEVSKGLKLGEVRHRKWKAVESSITQGYGISEGMDWLMVGDLV
ncbi:putative ADP-ribosylation factor [Aspergillus campestris IBT 28561]|uniref:ADP-ribosylation factor n=1 Tax=Aspergillus campestris (strain IBT 28561) TaxID=1392248 RepID=A0A2I1CRW0_ASPC2|nr:putative ADP-ribosylation factor [Aspergillus campestris IBT 28561]PKY00366.1 putative ADP-ribosylation factor [Aspergillus campestris IBT 28561]